jgi:hypothetical protein
MKKLSLFIILVLCFGFFSCKKLTTFEIKNSTQFTIPSAGGVGILGNTAPPVPTSSQTAFQNKGTDASHIKEIKLKKLSLTITSPSGQNFNFLDKVHIYISAAGLAEQEIANLDPVPFNGSASIDLNTTGIVLDDYVKKDTYNLRIAAETNSITTQNVDITADMTFSVRATIHK